MSLLLYALAIIVIAGASPALIYGIAEIASSGPSRPMVHQVAICAVLIAVALGGLWALPR